MNERREMPELENAKIEKMKVGTRKCKNAKIEKCKNFSVKMRKS